MPERFFDRVYKAATPKETRAVYDRFATEYDAEVTAQGYATPGRIADALAAALHDRAAPILDFGCGTGLSGAALAKRGFTTIDGRDLSPEMLALAGARGVYRSLATTGDGPTLGDIKGPYAAIVACGVIGAGAAPLPVLDTLLDASTPGALLAFSFNDHTLEDPSYEARVARAVASGEARQLFRQDGPHLPGLNMNAVVYVLEKT